MVTTALLLIFNTISIEQKLPPNLLLALCSIESSLNPKAVHKHDGNGNSYGLCQIKYATAKFMGFRGKIRELYDPAINVLYAAKYLSYQIGRYRGNYAKAITAYNAGSSNGHGGSVYLTKVFNKWAEYQLKETNNDRSNSKEANDQGSESATGSSGVRVYFGPGTALYSKITAREDRTVSEKSRNKSFHFTE